MKVGKACNVNIAIDSSKISSYKNKLASLEAKLVQNSAHSLTQFNSLA